MEFKEYWINKIMSLFQRSKFYAKEKNENLLIRNGLSRMTDDEIHALGIALTVDFILRRKG